MPGSQSKEKSFRRQDLVSAVDSQHVDEMFDITKSAKASELQDAMAELSKGKLEDFWESVYSMCTSTLMSDGDGETEDAEDTEFTMKMNLILKSTTDLAQATVTTLLAQRPNDENPKALAVPQSLKGSVILLHGMLPNVHDAQVTLKNQMCRLFEKWWIENLEGREEIGYNTLLHLLDRSTQAKSFLSDVSRVWAMRCVLECVDWNDRDTNTLVSLLKLCTHHPQFFSSNHGIRFLAYILRLTPDLTDTLHQSIKNIILTTPRSWHSKYGEIYYRSWQESNDEMRKKIEESCIQDLMFRAIHSSRQGSCSPSSTLYQVMAYLHKQKAQKGVDTMLLRLYGPILWRSLKVPNSDVRLNAACLMFNVVPLLDSNLNRKDVDAILQRQFDNMNSLLMDPVVEIRVKSVLGIGRVLFNYWELIPVKVIQSLVTTLVQDMVYDSAAPSVRQAVFKVMYQLCDNHLCIPMLKKVLPELGNFIHDYSEKVRVAVIDLLLKVKGIRAIKYWNIVPIEQILARLETDSSCFVVRRILNLISNSFAPMNHPPSQQVERCLVLISMNREAARKFYINLPGLLGVSDTVKHILVLCRFALQYTRKLIEKSVGGHLQSEDENEDSGDGGDAIGQRSKKLSKASDENDSGKRRRRSSRLSVSNPGNTDEEDCAADGSVAGTSAGGSGDDLIDMDSLSGLMEAVYLMLTNIASQRSSAEYDGVKEGLMKKLSVTVNELIKISDDHLLDDALVGLAGYLPSRVMRELSGTLFNNLKQRSRCEDGVRLGAGSTASMTCMVKALVQWGRAGDLFELVEGSFTAFLKEDVEIPPKGVKHSPKGRKKKTVAFDTQETVIDLDQAMMIVDDMLSHAECRPTLLWRHKAQTASLVEGLEKIIFIKIQTHLKCLVDASSHEEQSGARRKTGKNGFDPTADLALAVSVFSACARLATFLCLKPDAEKCHDDDETKVGRSYLQHCLSWTLQTILPHLESLSPSQLQQQHSYLIAVSQLIETVMKCCSGLLMVGINDQLISDQAGEICLTVLKLPLGSATSSLLENVLVFTYQLTQLRQVKDDEDKETMDVGEEDGGDKDKEDETGGAIMKTCTPSKQPLQFALLVFELALKVLTSTSEEQEVEASSTKGGRRRKSRSKRKAATTTDATTSCSGEGLAGACNTGVLSTRSLASLNSTATSILTALVKPGVCSRKLFDKTMTTVSHLVLNDLERVSRQKRVDGVSTTEASTSSSTTTAAAAVNVNDGGDDIGLNQNILTCLKRHPKTLNSFVEAIVHHLESEEVSVHLLQGAVSLADALKSKSSVAVNTHLQDVISDCVKTISPDDRDDVFKDLEQKISNWNTS